MILFFLNGFFSLIIYKISLTFFNVISHIAISSHYNYSYMRTINYSPYFCNFQQDKEIIILAIDYDNN